MAVLKGSINFCHDQSFSSLLVLNIMGIEVFKSSNLSHS
jgi:hypothetical protein